MLQDPPHFHRIGHMKLVALSFAILFSGPLALAQLDPASGLLLNSGTKSSNRENGLDSGRYTVRQRPDINAQEKYPEKNSEKYSDKYPDKNLERKKSPTIKQISDPVAEQSDRQNPAVAKKPPAAGPKTDKVESSTPPTSTPPPAKTTALTIEASDIGEQRKNLVELSIAPTFVYNHSQSDLSVRDYSSSSPAYHIDVNIWFEPSFAMHADLMNSLGASVDDSLDHSRNTNLIQQQLNIGIRNRHFLANKKDASSLTLGLDYSDSQYQVDNDSKLRNKLETSGFNLSLLAQLPQSTVYAWELGFELMPKAKHQETQTAGNFQSGDNPEANIISASLGGRIFFDASNQMFWRIHERLEKDQYLGSTSKPDPAGSKALTNVSVTNSTLMIELGYTWGN